MSTVEKENQNLSTIIFHVLEAVQYNMHPIDQAAGQIRYKKIQYYIIFGYKQG